jgi:hypothetical protein
MDIYGFIGIFMVDDVDDAWAFAEMNTEGQDDADYRVYAGKVDLDDALDLTDMDDMDDLLDAVEDAYEDVILLPDLSGVCDREILVRSSSAVRWE